MIFIDDELSSLFKTIDKSGGGGADEHDYIEHTQILQLLYRVLSLNGNNADK